MKEKINEKLKLLITITLVLPAILSLFFTSFDPGNNSVSLTYFIVPVFWILSHLTYNSHLLEKRNNGLINSILNLGLVATAGFFFITAIQGSRKIVGIINDIPLLGFTYMGLLVATGIVSFFCPLLLVLLLTLRPLQK